MKIGIIGAGMIGGTLARRLAGLGHDVAIANSRGPDTLRDFAAEVGARAVTPAEAARSGEIVVVTIPQGAVPGLPKNLFAGVPADVVVIDTGNYYPARDGRIEAIEEGLLDSVWVGQQLGRPVIKAFNSIAFMSLRDNGRPKGSPERIALSVAGASSEARAKVLRLVDELGFDPVDAGGIEESWRQHPGTPSYIQDLDAPRLKEALASAVRSRIPEYRKAANDTVKKYFESATRRLRTHSQTFSRGEKLGDYIYHRMVMDLFSRFPRSEMMDAPLSRIHDYVRDTAIHPLSVVSIKEAETEVPGFAGRSCPVQVVEIRQSSRTVWIVRASIDSPLAVSFGTKVLIVPTVDGHSTTTQSGITITDAVVFQDQQIHGIKVFERAMLAGRRSQPIVYATGTGKSFVLIAPAIANGKGIFIVPDEKQAQQLRSDVLRLDTDITEADVITAHAIESGHEAESIRKYKHLIIKKDRLPSFLPYLRDQLISIDEVHELPSHNLQALMHVDRNNVLQVVTATWTEPLQTILGDPLTEINMHFVLTKLKAFRNIDRNVLHFGASADLDARVFDMLVDYYGSVVYITNDNMPFDDGAASRYLTLDWLREPAARRVGLDAAISRVRTVNEVRRFDHMNMAFSKNLPLLVALTEAYQGVFDGTYPRLDELAETVSRRRASARVAEELRLANMLLGIDSGAAMTADVEAGVRFETVVRESRVDGRGMQLEARHVLKQQIANVITRRVVGLFSDNTPPSVIRAHEVRRTLPALLALYSGDSGHLDPHQRAFIERMGNRDPGSVYDKIASALARVDDRERILSSVADGDFTALQIHPTSIDLDRFSAVRYATLVRPGDEQGAADAARRVNSGYHTHIIGDSELATGYSNPDIMSVQRVIEHVIPEGATRAAQIGGRATRDKDGVAFLSEYLGPDVNVEGALGTKGGRPFLFEDVLAPDYGKRVKQYRVNLNTE